MIVIKDLLVGVFMFIIAHIITFYQLNGQFLKTDWFRKNEIWVAAFGQRAQQNQPPCHYPFGAMLEAELLARRMGRKATVGLVRASPVFR